MSSFLLLLSAVSFVAPSVIATTPFERHNLVYRSPYANDESLAVDTQSVYKRHMDSGDKLYKRQQLLKRGQKTTRPGGKPDNYIESGYGGAVTKWDDATYIYAGDLNFSK
jgi:alkaline phosphatase D